MSDLPGLMVYWLAGPLSVLWFVGGGFTVWDGPNEFRYHAREMPRTASDIEDANYVRIALWWSLMFYPSILIIVVAIGLEAFGIANDVINGGGALLIFVNVAYSFPMALLSSIRWGLSRLWRPQLDTVLSLNRLRQDRGLIERKSLKLRLVMPSNVDILIALVLGTSMLWALYQWIASVA